MNAIYKTKGVENKHGLFCTVTIFGIDGIIVLNMKIRTIHIFVCITVSILANNEIRVLSRSRDGNCSKQMMFCLPTVLYTDVR